MKRVLKHILRFLLLIFIQVFILNQIVLPGSLNGYVNPNIYILFLLMLPLNINRNLLLVISFLCGLTIDFFNSTAGMHASACLVIGLSRPAFINVVIPRDGYENTVDMTVGGLGFQTFFIYSGVLTFVHHFILYLIEAFNFINFIDLLLRVVVSGIATLVLIAFSQLLTLKNK